MLHTTACAVTHFRRLLNGPFHHWHHFITGIFQLILTQLFPLHILNNFMAVAEDL